MANHNRFIPAPAGNGSARAIVNSLLTVHPRACGERGPQVDAETVGGGSSPRLRGTEFGCLIGTKAERFIPAPAGNGRKRESK